MAYRKFSEPLDVETPDRLDPDGFSALEWSVIALAGRDPLSSLDIPGRIASALATLFGQRGNLGLADPRLEALRRFVVLARHARAALPDDEMARFLAAGFSRAQAGRLLSLPSGH